MSSAGDGGASSGPIGVPLGQIGDAVHYAVSFRNSSNPDWIDAAELSFEVDRTAGAASEAGAAASAVWLRWNEPYRPLRAFQRPVNEELAVSLETRRPIMLREAGVSASGHPFHVTSFGELHESYLVPGFYGAKQGFPGLGFDLQGKLLVPGSTLPLDALIAPGDVERIVVGKERIIYGSRAVGVTYHFPLRAWDLVYGELLDARMTLWMSPLVPYPVRVEEVTVFAKPGQEPTQQEWRHVLTGYRPGTTSIPWGPSGSAGQPSVERSGLHAYRPVQGSSLRLAYPLEEALQAMHADATLSEFRAWKASHPDHRLVSMEYGLTRDAVVTDSALAAVPRWYFAFGDNRGSGFLVETRRPGPLGIAANFESGRDEGGHPAHRLGAISIPKLAPTDVPQDPVSLTGAAVRV